MHFIVCCADLFCERDARLPSSPVDCVIWQGKQRFEMFSKLLGILMNPSAHEGISR
jgi:hypothetical protein